MLLPHFPPSLNYDMCPTNDSNIAPANHVQKTPPPWKWQLLWDMAPTSQWQKAPRASRRSLYSSRTEPAYVKAIPNTLSWKLTDDSSPGDSPPVHNIEWKTISKILKWIRVTRVESNCYCKKHLKGKSKKLSCSRFQHQNRCQSKWRYLMLH